MYFCFYLKVYLSNLVVFFFYQFGGISILNVVKRHLKFNFDDYQVKKWKKRGNVTIIAAEIKFIANKINIR